MNFTSFYGGPSGQSFTIRKIFTSRYNIAGEKTMAHDLARGWTSNVSVGEFVMIKYGLPGSEEYDTNRNIDITVDGKAYNATLWQKVYDETTGNANGLDYILIASLAGNTPKIQVTDTIVLDPLENPDVEIDIENPDFPELTFSLPRAVKFWYGDRLGKKKDGTYIDSSEEYKDCGIGDYYINRATGFIYLVTNKVDNTCTFEFKACFQTPTPEIATNPISPYTPDKQINIPSVEKEFIDEEETEWRLKFNLPKTPNFVASAETANPFDQANASSIIYDENTLQIIFKIPRGSRIIPGGVLESESNLLDRVKPGDFFLDTTSGKLYLLNQNLEWVLQEGTLKGPVGEPLHIEDKLELIETEDFENNLENGKQAIEDKYAEDASHEFKSDQLYQVTWINGDQHSYYWYFITERGEWGRIQILGGGAGGEVENEYNPGIITDRGYSINYINSLIKDKVEKDPIGATMRKTTLSTNLLIDLLSWGSYEDALGDSAPVPDILTVSKLEILTEPNQLIYEIGDTLNTLGLTIQATRQDNSIQNIDITEYTFVPMILNTQGVQPISVIYTLEDGTQITTSFNVIVGSRNIAIPTWKEDLYYNGNQRSPDNIEYWNGYNKSLMTMEATSQVNVGSYEATFILLEGLTWSDGTNIPKQVTWGIQQGIISGVPSQDGVIVFDGAVHSPSWTNFNENQVEVSFEPQSAVGVYNAEFTTKIGYKWADTDDRTKIINWQIVAVSQK